MNKAELVQELQNRYAQWQSLISQIDVERMEQPGVNGDWSVKDVVGHLTGWNRWLLMRLQAAQRGETEPIPPWPAHLESEDDINAWIYDAYRTRSLREVLDETQHVQQQLVAAIDSMPDDTRIELVEPHFHLVWVGEQRFVAGEFFDHFRDDHEPDVRAWLERSA